MKPRRENYRGHSLRRHIDFGWVAVSRSGARVATGKTKRLCKAALNDVIDRSYRPQERKGGTP
jgi:hypothetical protein